MGQPYIDMNTGKTMGAGYTLPTDPAPAAGGSGYAGSAPVIAPQPAADPIPEDPQFTAPKWLSSPGEAINSVIRPNSMSAASYNARPDPAITVSQPGSPARVGADTASPSAQPGTITAAAQAGSNPGTADRQAAGYAPTSVPVPTLRANSVNTTGNVISSTSGASPATIAQYNAMKAQDANIDNARAAGMARNANAAGAWVNARDAASDARVAHMNAASPLHTGSAVDQIIGARGDQAAYAAAKAHLDQANGAVIAANAPVAGPDALDQAAKTQAMVQGAQTGALAQAEGQQKIQAGQMTLENQKRLTDLGNQFSAETDPKRRQQLQDSILTMMGKERPGDWKLVHAPGGEVTDPNNPMMKTKLPDHVVAINERSGETHVQQLYGSGSQPGAAAPGKLPEGFTGKDANGRAFKIVNGQPVAM